MKFLVVGASGFIGGHILNYIKQAGYEVAGTQCQSNQDVLIKFDLEKDSIEESVGPSFFKTHKKVFVIICASLNQMDRCLIEKELSYKINVERTTQLVRDIAKYQAIPVFLSTSAVYNGELGYYNEQSVHDPINEYGRQKEAMEQFLLKDVPRAFILRLDKIVSDDTSGKNLFSEWYQKIRQNQPIICIEQLFSPTFVKDIAEAIIKAAQCRLSGAYNVVNPEFFTRVDLAKQFIAAVGKETDVILKSHEEFNFADRRIKYSYLDSTKFRKETGMQFTSMREVFTSFLKSQEHYDRRNNLTSVQNRT